MSRGTLGRIEKLERQQADSGQWIEWEDDDGTIVYLDWRISHEEALALLD